MGEGRGRGRRETPEGIETKPPGPVFQRRTRFLWAKKGKEGGNSSSVDDVSGELKYLR